MSWKQNFHCFCVAVSIVAVTLDTLTISDMRKFEFAFAIDFVEESIPFSNETCFQDFLDLFFLFLQSYFLSSLCHLDLKQKEKKENRLLVNAITVTCLFKVKNLL